MAERLSVTKYGRGETGQRQAAQQRAWQGRDSLPGGQEGTMEQSCPSSSCP